MKKGYVLVEGHGEANAAHNLISRISQSFESPVVWSPPLRWKNIHLRRGIERGVEFIRAKGDAGALLLLRDEDDACPRSIAPEQAGWLRELRPPCPSAIVLLHPEYEVLFLPCLSSIAGKSIDGRPGLIKTTKWDCDTWEARRGVKEWLSDHMPPGRIYKPTLDQLPLTRWLDLEVLREADVPCFGTLERAIRFLCEQFAGEGVVYPPAAQG